MAVTGELPKGMGQYYQIHHKTPREFGGDNSFDNLMIMRQEPYHAALSREMQLLTSDMGLDDVKEVAFPTFSGVVFYDPS